MTLDDLSGMLKATPERVAKLAEINRAAGPMFVNDVHRFFEAETDPDGRAWESLAESTLDAPVNKSRKRGDGGKILQRTGAMRRSVSFDSNASRIVIGAVPHYSSHHQNGTSRMPRRAFLGFKKATVDRWFNAIFAYVVKGEKDIRFG